MNTTLRARGRCPVANSSHVDLVGCHFDGGGMKKTPEGFNFVFCFLSLYLRPVVVALVAPVPLTDIPHRALRIEVIKLGLCLCAAAAVLVPATDPPQIGVRYVVVRPCLQFPSRRRRRRRRGQRGQISVQRQPPCLSLWIPLGSIDSLYSILVLECRTRDHDAL